MKRASLDTQKLRNTISKKSTSTEELLKIYRQVAKTADSRLLRLEKLQGQKNFQNVKRYAYKRAAMDAAEWGANPDKPRFNIAPPKTKTGEVNRAQIRGKINDILSFLEKPTSTKKGIIEIYQKRADTLNKKSAEKGWGLTFTWEDVGEFFESKLYKKLDSSFGSETRIKAIGKIKENEEAVLRAFKEDRKNHKKTSLKTSSTRKATKDLSEDDIIVQQAINKMVADYPAEVRKMLKLM